MPRNITSFSVTNWVIVPAPWRVDQPPSPSDQRWLLTLSGIALVDFQGQSSSDWTRDTLNLEINLDGAFQTAGVQPSPNYFLSFQVEQWAPFSTINAIYNQGPSVDAGFAVDYYQPMFYTRTNDRTGITYSQLFGGLSVAVAVREVPGWIYRIGYYITLLGIIVETPVITVP